MALATLGARYRGAFGAHDGVEEAGVECERPADGCGEVRGGGIAGAAVSTLSVPGREAHALEPRTGVARHFVVLPGGWAVSREEWTAERKGEEARIGRRLCKP